MQRNKVCKEISLNQSCYKYAAQVYPDNNNFLIAPMNTALPICDATVLNSFTTGGHYINNKAFAFTKALYKSLYLLIL